METKSGKFEIGTVTDWAGNQIQVNKTFDFSYREFASIEEAKTAKDGYSDKDILSLINGAEKGGAKSNEYQKQLNLIKGEPSDEQKREMKIKQTIANLVSLNVPREIAEQQVQAMFAAATPSA